MAIIAVIFFSFVPRNSSARTFMATVLVHAEDLVLRASFVTRMLKLWPIQSLAN